MNWGVGWYKKFWFPFFINNVSENNIILLLGPFNVVNLIISMVSRRCQSDHLNILIITLTAERSLSLSAAAFPNEAGGWCSSYLKNNTKPNGFKHLFSHKSAIWVGLSEDCISTHLESAGQLKIWEAEGTEGLLPLLSVAERGHLGLLYHM